MSSSIHDGTNSIIHNIYNSSEWKPLTFTLVEYPKGKFVQTLNVIRI